jgi:subtilase family serine protease
LSALIVLGLASGANAQQVRREGSVYYKAVCPPVSWESARCESFVVTDSNGRVLESKTPPIAGKTPANLRSAYKITANGQASTIIAIVDAFGYDNAEADLGVYRAEWGLPACTTDNGCFKKLNQKGQEGPYPAQNDGWALESALDLDMASAMCPGCTIYLIEADTNSFKNLGASENLASQIGAHVISNSYCGTEARGDLKFQGYYDHPGIAITAAAGDAGYGMCSPADMPTVVAVGGTFLTTDSDKRGWTETVWNGTGSGCSTVFPKPKWQTDTGCAMRTNNDVAADASPSSGVAVYDSNWQVVGGTSVATPIIGGIFGANGGRVKAAYSIYKHPGWFYDVTTGSNGTCSPAYLCTGEVGYDGPTGNGTPHGMKAFGDNH